MKFDKNNWVHNLALEHCLIDPRLSNELSHEITLFIIKLNSDDLEMKSKLQIEDVIAISSFELFAHGNHYCAKGKTLDDKLSIKKRMAQLYNSTSEKIKLAIKESIINETALKLDELNLPDSLIKATLAFNEKIRTSFEKRSFEITQSFSSPNMEINKTLLSDYKDIGGPSNDEGTGNGGFDTKVIPLKKTSSASLTSGIGRPKIGREHMHRQEDYAGIVSDIKLHDSWKNRIPELLMLVSQKLTVELYKDIPPIDWTNYLDSKVFNSSSNGATLTMLFTYLDNVYIFNAGDSPAIYIQKDRSSGEANVKLLTFPHHPTENTPAERKEQQRVVAEGGAIDKNRVKNFFGDMALSRAIGDLSALGMSDIGQIIHEKILNEATHDTLFAVGSDGLFDFLNLMQLKKLSELIKAQDLSKCFCHEAFRNKLNRDNITGITFPYGFDIFAYVADGHGDICVSEYISKHLPIIFRTIAEAMAPSIVNIQEIQFQPAIDNTIPTTPNIEISNENASEKIIPPPKRRFNVSANDSDSKSEDPKNEESNDLALKKYKEASQKTLSMFFDEPVKETELSTSTYNREQIVKKIKSLPYYYDDIEDIGQLEEDLVQGEIQSSFFVRKSNKASEGYYVFHHVVDDEVKTILMYIPTEIPMSYEEYKKILNNNNIIRSEKHLDMFLSELQASKVVDFESEILTQSPVHTPPL